ncbi:MAG: MerR family transcriptional regulator [Candidatus Pacebacteria bacterium]|nr:MerR family transcriptional regulator [Candidatus Paceibacterota bacterium]
MPSQPLPRHSGRNEKSPEAFRIISEVAEEIGVKPHVLRFWETKFPQLKPVKRAGGRRYYRPEDVELLKKIKKLLRQDNYRIEGAQKLLKVNSHNLPAAAAGSSTAVSAETALPKLSVEERIASMDKILSEQNGSGLDREGLIHELAKIRDALGNKD